MISERPVGQDKLCLVDRGDGTADIRAHVRQMSGIGLHTVGIADYRDDDLPITWYPIVQQEAPHKQEPWSVMVRTDLQQWLAGRAA